MDNWTGLRVTRPAWVPCGRKGTNPKRQTHKHAKRNKYEKTAAKNRTQTRRPNASGRAKRGVAKNLVLT